MYFLRLKKNFVLLLSVMILNTSFSHKVVDPSQNISNISFQNFSITLVINFFLFGF